MSRSSSPTSLKQVSAYVSVDARRFIGLAAVYSRRSRSNFVARASVAAAVSVLRKKNPSALDGTEYEVAKSA